MDVDIDALLDSALENNGQVTFPQPKQERAEQRDDRDRDRHRDRDRDRERHKKRSRSEDRDDDRSSRRHKHSRSRSRERRRSRSRSRDRGRRHSDQRDKERARDRERREREEMRRIQREQEALLPAADREAIEFERDQRTVFAFNLPIKADEDDIADFFSKAGKVRDIRLITDRNSRKSKGFAYIEFSDKNTVPEALTFHNKPMMGQIIQVQQTQAEKNRQAGSTMTTTTTFGPTRVYISGLTINVSDDDLRKLFTKFGAVEFVNLLHDPDTGKSKGFAFIQFKRAEDAKRSVMELNGMELYGRIITVGFVSEKDSMNTRKGAMNEFDDEDRGLKMNNAFRVMLSEKLLKTDNPVIGQKPLQLSKLAPEPVTKPTAAFPSSSPPSSPPPMPKAPPSPCVKLTNMFDPGTETESNWDQEIREEVSDECKRFGSIVHIFVDKNSEGHVYLKFGSIPGAQNAINALDKRWFAGRQVTADFVPEKIYYSKFPDAKNK